MEIKAKVEEIKDIGRRDRKGRRMILVKMENRKRKIAVMKKRKALKKRTERIYDDWTWNKRAMQWRLEKITWNERKKKRNAWVRYGKIWIRGSWWKNKKEKRLKLKKREENSNKEKREKSRKKRELKTGERKEKKTEK